MTLLIRTDNEVLLAVHDSGTVKAEHHAHADRQLAEQLPARLMDTLSSAAVRPADLKGIVIYAGPGSFTSLRIGFSIANTLAWSLNIPIVAVSSDEWIEQGQDRLTAGENNFPAQPHYGAEANITKPRK